jgi:hypothetical protein
MIGILEYRVFNPSALGNSRFRTLGDLAGEESQPLGLAPVRIITIRARRDERREYQDKGVNGSLAESSKQGEEKGV